MCNVIFNDKQIITYAIPKVNYFLEYFSKKFFFHIMQKMSYD